MSAMNVNAVAGVEKFTDELLAKNFVAIAKGFQDMERWIAHLEGHVGELYEMAKTAAEVQVKVKTPSRVKPFLFGAVVGVAVFTYATGNTRKVREVVEKAKEEATSRVEKAKGEAASRLEDLKDAVEEKDNDSKPGSNDAPRA